LLDENLGTGDGSRRRGRDHAHRMREERHLAGRPRGKHGGKHYGRQSGRHRAAEELHGRLL